MNRFDELFDADQPADELEAALREMFARRSADITEPAALRAGTDAPIPLFPRLANRATEVPGGLPGTLLAAAMVALLVLGSVLTVRNLTQHRNSAATHPSPSSRTVSSPAPSPSPTESPTATSPATAAGCPLPASWTAAIAGSRIAVDQPQNYPASAGPDGSFLMLQSATGPGPGGETDYTHQELAIFDRAGHGSTIWQAADPVNEVVNTSPDSAVSAHWVVFGLTHSQSLAVQGIAAWNRQTGRLTTVRRLSAAELATNKVIDFSPIVVGDTAYWVEQKFNDSAQQRLVSQQLPDGARQTRPVSRVNRLIAVGSGLALLRDQDPGVPGTTNGQAETLTAGAGLVIPADVLRLGAGGRWFSSDATTLRWLATRNGAVLLVGWSSESGLSVDTVANAPSGAGPVGPFLVSPDGSSVLDTRNGSTLRLPSGLQFVLATAGDLILTTGSTKFGATAVHRVALSALPPIRC